MIPLDSPRWAEFTHAHGVATDIPPLLRELSDFPPYTSASAQPYRALRESLCDDGSVCIASYAAVPHIVAALAEAPARANEAYFLLPTVIEIGRHASGAPELPDELRTAYEEAIAALPSLAGAVTRADIDESYARTLAATVAVAAGHVELGEGILWLDPRRLKRFRKWAPSW